jgi:hypothetical protein
MPGKKPAEKTGSETVGSRPLIRTAGFLLKPRELSHIMMSLREARLRPT